MGPLRRLARWLALPAAAGAAAACGQDAQDVDAPTPPDTHDAAATPQRHRPRTPSFLIARVKPAKHVALRDRPGGDVVAEMGDHTEFGTPTAVPVLKRKGRWLGVATTKQPNRKLAWVKRDRRAMRMARTKTWLRVDLSRRRLQALRGRRVVESVKVGVGKPASPTPAGTFAVTDKLPGRRFGSYYGRFILALSGKQPKLPPGWPGGNRLAIHGTDAPARIGKETSAGCVVAPDPALERLVDDVPLGTPVVIKR
jgi:lipoprotein-anchoring transpeptidase ErfK/SrfK